MTTITVTPEQARGDAYKPLAAGHEPPTALWTTYHGDHPLVIPAELCAAYRAALEPTIIPAPSPDRAGYMGDAGTPAERRRAEEAARPIMDLAGAVVRMANAVWWRLDLRDATYNTLRYRPGHRLGGHTDMHPGAFTTRKLSASVELSPPDAYEGGELQLADFNPRHGDPAWPGWRWRTPPGGQGAITVFPGWAPHRVTELTRGERWVLVVWCEGPPIR